MAYRKLGRDSKHRRSMLANLTIDVIMNGSIETTETRAKEVRRCVDKMITYGKNGSLVSRRKALAFLMNNTDAVKKVFEELAPKYKDRNGGYTRILKLDERRGDDWSREVQVYKKVGVGAVITNNICVYRNTSLEK